MLNDWSHKVRAILKEYCPGNIKKLLPSLSQSGNTRFYFGHQKLCMDNKLPYWNYVLQIVCGNAYGNTYVNNKSMIYYSVLVSVSCPKA